ncbi:MAG TPA: ATP-binding cassette domain-containing protein [Bacteroidia bacterium]|jgi:phospholipid/cholesterol/gamma-HCH transport system ATP-binding protein|nr:ATP-binding cassette domain-containing protein [Bacteroidia bacterium]
MDKEPDTLVTSPECRRPEGEIIVEVEGLKISFGKKEVLKNMNLWLKKGENLVVLGKSGSGKSVLIKCLIGLLEPENGKIEVLKKDISILSIKELNKLRKRIGFLFQSAALYDSMTVRENLEFPLRDSHDKSKEEITSIVEEVLVNVGLADAIDKMPSELSGGMRKRIGLARTLILKPEIILYDEPTTGLDPITSKEISNLIIEMQKKYIASSVIITHDIECAKIVANRMIILKDGMCYAEGIFNELEKSEDKWVRSFFE